MGSRTPLPPEADAVERQYGSDAELYAEVRADVAKASGREQDARQWDDVQSQIEQAKDEDSAEQDPG